MILYIYWLYSTTSPPKKSNTWCFHEILWLLGYCEWTELRESECSSDESESCERKSTTAVNLQLGSLESYHQLDESGDTSVFASNGANRDRLKELLKNPQCPCQCTMPLTILWKCCMSFWALGKQTQDAVLWSLQSSSERASTWSIEGLNDNLILFKYWMWKCF